MYSVVCELFWFVFFLFFIRATNFVMPQFCLNIKNDIQKILIKYTITDKDTTHVQNNSAQH